MTAIDAPDKFAITSNTSAVRVVVKYRCINSIAIPKKNDNTSETIKSS
nr:hypothetical protein [Flavobacterium soyangense]